MAPDAEATPPAPHGWRAGFSRLGPFFPPARCTWIALVLLGLWGVRVFGGPGATSLLLLPAAAATTDLAFQSLRFDRYRFPDGAVATGLFLALILTPTVPIAAAGTVTIAAIAAKHLLRVRGRPILNPAAAGAVLGAFAFGLAPAWWVGIGPLGEVAMVVAGAALVARSAKTWRIPVTFFLVFAPLSLLLRLTEGTSLAPNVILLGVLDPSTVFFGLFMVSEPRTAPADPRHHLLYGTLVGWGAAFLPTYLPTTSGLVALLLVGAGFGTYRALRRAWSRPRAPASGRLPASDAAATGRRPWGSADRAAVGFLVLVVVAAVAASGISPSGTPTTNIAHPSHPPGGSPPSPTPGGGGMGGSGVSAAGCTKDNASIPAATAAMLHTALGPSVLLAYDASTGVTVFYDPVNLVTVTETDLYEDYGYAEFNGDDYAVSGCAP